MITKEKIQLLIDKNIHWNIIGGKLCYTDILEDKSVYTELPEDKTEFIKVVKSIKKTFQCTECDRCCKSVNIDRPTHCSFNGFKTEWELL